MKIDYKLLSIIKEHNGPFIQVSWLLSNKFFLKDGKHGNFIEREQADGSQATTDSQQIRFRKKRLPFPETDGRH